MDNTAIFNRSVWDVTGLAHDEWRTVGDNAHGRRVSVPLAGSIKGQLWLGSQLAPRDFRPRGDFKTYATRWEQRYSVLIPDRTASLDFVPVVSDKSRVSYNLPSIFGGTQYVYPVIAHHGTASVTEIIVLRKYATDAFGANRRNALESLLDEDVEVYVEQGYPGGDWGPFADSNNLGPNNFTVLTDPDGRILVILDAYGDEPGLESEDPLSYLMIAPALLDLMKVGGRMVLRMASQRAARKAALLAAARAVAESVLKKEGKLSAEEMIAHLTGIVQQHPELRRLMAARVLTEQRLASATLEALGDWARARGRRVVWKTEAEMVAVTKDAKNLMTLQGNELWINEEAKALKEAKVFYQEVVHELASDSLGYRGSGLAKFFIEMQNGMKYTDQTLLENAVLRGNIEQVVRFFAGT